MRKVALLTILPLIIALVVGISFADNVEKGKALFSDPSLGTNGKSCSSCHPNGSGINGKKTTFTIMGKKLNSPEEAVNFCISMALKGEPLDTNSEEMKALVSYLKTLTGKKKRRKIIRGC